MAYRTLNPATGALLKTFTHLPSSQVPIRLDKAVAAQKALGRKSIRERGALIARVAKLLREKQDDLGAIITTETGKTLAQSKWEVNKCATACDHIVEHGESYLATEPFKTDGSQSYVRYDPLGTILAIMPWNFPFWQVFRFAAPAVLAGNVCLLKHAPNVPQCALAMERLFVEAGAEEGVMQNLFVDDATVATILADPRVAGVTLTGSVRAGRAVASQAGAHIKKSVLELGGSDPFIVLKDADMNTAINVAVASRLGNCGQACIAAKRFIIEEPVAKEFTDRLVERFAQYKTGDPTAEGVDMGPMAREDLRDGLAALVQKSVEAGAKIAVGGPLSLPGALAKGFFYSPTVMTNITIDMPVFREETFGPVAPILVVKNAEEAIEIANQSDYGLGATVITSDVSKANDLAARIHAGGVFFNGQVKSDPRMPFGGVKDSGFGRELGRAGIMEWVNVKSVWVA